MNKKKRKSKPNSLYHYTSFEVLNNIVDVENGLLSFHLCNPLQSNDKKEVNFFKDYLIYGKTGEEIETHMKELETRIGHPYTLCLIHERRAKETKHEIAMWEMYGDKSKGVKIRLDFKELEAYCKQEPVKLDFCKYNNHSEMRSIAQEDRIFLKRCDFNAHELERVYQDTIFYKDCQWIEENEWRLATWCNDHTKIGYHQNGKSFVRFLMPIKCLKSIEIGPKADQPVIKQKLDIFADNILQKYSINVCIKESKLPIR